MLPRLSLSEARLDGKYDVKVFVTSNSFHSKPAPRQAFRFIPKCDEGACDVTLLGAMAFTQGLADRQAAGERSGSMSDWRYSAAATEGRRSTSGRSATLSRIRIAGRSQSSLTG